VVNNRKKVDLLKQLEEMGFDKLANDAKEKKKKAAKAKKGATDDDDEEENESKAVKKAETGYNYLLSMPIWNLTMERVRHYGLLIL
jgi:DNA topoisomerase-2